MWIVGFVNQLRKEDEWHYSSQLSFFCSKDDSDSSNQLETNPVVTYDVSISSSVGGRINIFTRNGGNTESGPYKAGTVLRITATPNDGYEFIGWTGSNETSMEITITVNSDITLTANFEKIPENSSNNKVVFNKKLVFQSGIGFLIQCILDRAHRPLVAKNDNFDGNKSIFLL